MKRKRKPKMGKLVLEHLAQSTHKIRIVDSDGRTLVDQGHPLVAHLEPSEFEHVPLKWYQQLDGLNLRQAREAALAQFRVYLQE